MSTSSKTWLIFGLLIVSTVIAAGAWLVRMNRQDRMYELETVDGERVEFGAIKIRDDDSGEVVFHDSVFLVTSISPKFLRPGFSWVVCGRGTGVLRGPVHDAGKSILPLLIGRIRLPAAVPVTVQSTPFSVEEGQGFSLSFHWLGKDADVHDRGPAADTGDAIWLDPKTHRAEVLLPSAGRWRMRWARIDRHEDGSRPTISIVHESGEVEVDVAGDRRVIQLDLK